MAGPYCMGEGAGGAKGDGSCSAAFESICICCAAVVFPPNYSGVGLVRLSSV